MLVSALSSDFARALERVDGQTVVSRISSLTLAGFCATIPRGRVTSVQICSTLSDHGPGLFGPGFAAACGRNVRRVAGFQSAGLYVGGFDDADFAHRLADAIHYGAALRPFGGVTALGDGGLGLP